MSIWRWIAATVIFLIAMGLGAFYWVMMWWVIIGVARS